MEDKDHSSDKNTTADSLADWSPTGMTIKLPWPHHRHDTMSLIFSLLAVIKSESEGAGIYVQHLALVYDSQCDTPQSLNDGTLLQHNRAR